MNMLLDLLGWAGAVTGVLGAFLLAIRSKYSKWGWVSFLVSNAFWLGFALESETTSLLIQTMAFTATTLLGLWQWIIKPALRHQNAPNRT